MSKQFSLNKFKSGQEHGFTERLLGHKQVQQYVFLGSLIMSNCSFKDLIQFVKQLTEKNYYDYLNGDIPIVMYSYTLAIDYLLRLLFLREDKKIALTIIDAIRVTRMNPIEYSNHKDWVAKNFETVLIERHGKIDVLGQKKLEEIRQEPIRDLVSFVPFFFRLLYNNKLFDEIRKMIFFQTTSYVSWQKKVLESNDLSSWLVNRVTFAAYTNLIKFFYIYDYQVRRERAIIYDYDENNNVIGGNYDNGCEMVLWPYMTELFSDLEIHEIKENFKYLEEKMVYTLPNENDELEVLVNLGLEKERVYKIFESQGYYKAREYLAYSFRSCYYLPKFIFEEILLDIKIKK